MTNFFHTFHTIIHLPYHLMSCSVTHLKMKHITKFLINRKYSLSRLQNSTKLPPPPSNFDKQSLKTKWFSELHRYQVPGWFQVHEKEGD